MGKGGEWGRVGLNTRRTRKNTMNNKEQHWQRLAERFAATTDDLGQPLDPKILDAVVALNVLGFETTASCEGHTEGSYAPYVDIAIDTPADEKERLFEALRHAESDEEIRAGNDLFEQLNVYYLQVRRRLMDLLIAFYQDRHVSYDHLLSLHPRRDVFGCVEDLRLQCAGAEDLDLNDAAERVVKLNVYQREIQAFATFLKEKYFEED